MSVPRGNAQFAALLAESVRRQDAEALIELTSNLGHMPGLQAHDVIEQADAVLGSEDRLFLDLFLEAVAPRRVEVLSKPLGEAQLWNE